MQSHNGFFDSLFRLVRIQARDNIWAIKKVTFDYVLHIA